MQRITIPVEDMACDGCEQTVETALTDRDDVEDAEADHERGDVEVVLDDGAATADLEAVIREAGYEPSTRP